MIEVLIKRANSKSVTVKINEKKWPEFYECNFLEQGMVSYEDVGQGKALLKKEAIDKMLPSFKGKPVIDKRHRNIDPENYEKYAVGYITDVWFDIPTGWYRCRFLLTNDDAKKSIADGYGVSCSFKVIATEKGGSWHAMPYDEEITEGEGEHLAIVDTPRYEECRIFCNSRAATIENALKYLCPHCGHDVTKEKETQYGIVCPSCHHDFWRSECETIDENGKKNKGRIENMSKENGIDIMSPLQRDKYLEGLSDSGIQALIDSADESAETKKLATQHQAMRKQQKEEELLGQGKPGKEKKNMNKYNAADLMIKDGEAEISVAELIKQERLFVKEGEKVMNALITDTPGTGEPKHNDDKATCDKCGEKKHDGDCIPEKKNAFEKKKADDAAAEKKKADDDAEALRKKNEEEAEEKKKIEAARANALKDSKHFVRLNTIKENAAVVQGAVIDTLANKIERGKERY